MENTQASFYFRSLISLFLVTQIFVQNSISSTPPTSHILNDRCCPVEKNSPCQCENVTVYNNSKSNAEICDKDKICGTYNLIEERMLRIRTNSNDNAATNFHGVLRTFTFTEFCESHSWSSQEDCVRNVTGTNRTDQTDNKTVIYVNGSNYFNYVRTTIDKTLIDRLNGSLINEANFAPWEWMINYDANRNPQMFLETRCLFRKCLNANRNDVDIEYDVHPLKVTRYFKMNGVDNKIFNSEFSIGCICERSGKSLHRPKCTSDP